MNFVALLVLVALAASANGYTTSGNKVIDPTGKAVLLRGICRPSTEWAATGENIGVTDWTNMKNWGANVIRITMNQCFWNTNQNAYQTFIGNQITAINNMGMGVIIDLHWSDKGTGSNCGQQTMPDVNSVTFWKSVASKYKSNPWVIFELYNEPHDVSWSVWKNGGDAGGFTTPGMQSLLNTVRNDAGAPNAVIINGLNYAYDLSGVPSNLISGSNIIYGTHPYDYAGKQPSDWPNGFRFLASTFPVMATEFGNYNCDPAYYNSFIAYANQHDISWTAWGWYPSGCSFPSVISDWSGTPTVPGSLIKAQLQTGPKVPSSSGSTTGGTTTAKPTTTTTTGTTTSMSTTTTTTKAPSSNGVKITAVVNNGTGQYWVHVDSFTGSTKTITGCQFKDSLAGANWVAGYTESWGPGWSFNPNRIIVTPISLQLTASDNSIITLTNVILSTAGGGSYLSTTNF